MLSYFILFYLVLSYFTLFHQVLVYCVNDGAVMEGWAREQKVKGSMITFLADTRTELTEALVLSPTAPFQFNASQSGSPCQTPLPVRRC
eukprot:SAG31_NODE_16304_length_714_cov_0.972358_1_plen_89_part_00